MTTAIRMLRIAALSIMLLLAGAVLLSGMGHGGQGRTALAQAPTPTPSPPHAHPPPLVYRYPAGWNLLAGSVVVTDTTVYEYRSDSGTYERLRSGSQLQRGRGYWVYFPFPNQVSVTYNPACDAAVAVPRPTPAEFCWPAQPPVPLPAGQWLLIGNPYSIRIGLVGADAVYTYDSMQGEYVRADRVTFYDPRNDAYGQADVLDGEAGAFVYSAQGGLLTYVPIDLQPPP